jgi:hypothetical protein
LVVSPPNASIAIAAWLSAGEPTTKPIRLPLRSDIFVTPVSFATPKLPPLQSTVDSVTWTGCGPHSLAANSNTPSCAKYTPEPMPEATARPARSGCRRATSLPAGSTRTSVPCLSFIILPMATVMLKPAVPVSYAVIVSVCGSLVCAEAPLAITVPAKATDTANRMIWPIIKSLPFCVLGREFLACCCADHVTGTGGGQCGRPRHRGAIVRHTARRAGGTSGR